MALVPLVTIVPELSTVMPLPTVPPFKVSDLPEEFVIVFDVPLTVVVVRSRFPLLVRLSLRFRVALLSFNVPAPVYVPPILWLNVPPVIVKVLPLVATSIVPLLVKLVPPLRLRVSLTVIVPLFVKLVPPLTVRGLFTVIVPLLVCVADALFIVMGRFKVIVPPVWLSTWAVRVRLPPIVFGREIAPVFVNDPLFTVTVTE